MASQEVDDTEFSRQMAELVAANDMVYGKNRRPPDGRCRRGAYAENKRTGDFTRARWKELYARSDPAE